MSGRPAHLRAVTPVSREGSSPSGQVARSRFPVRAPTNLHDSDNDASYPSHPHEVVVEQYQRRQRSEPQPQPQYQHQHQPHQPQPPQHQPPQDFYQQYQSPAEIQRKDRHQQQPLDPNLTFGGQVRIATMVHRVHGGDSAQPQAPKPRRRGSRPRVQADAAKQGKVVVFLSGHGGTGATTLACNVATTAARAGQAVCIVDLDLQLGDCLAMLDLNPQCPMSRLVSEAQFDWEMLETMLARHPSGALVLSQVGCLEELAELTPERLPWLLRRLQQRFDLVVVDGVRDFGDVSIAALDLAESIVLVASQDVPAVRGVSRRLHILRRLGYQTEKMRLVINRHSKDSPVPVHAISDALKIAPSFLIPNDAPVAERAMTEGLTLHQADCRAALTYEVERMTRALSDLPPPTDDIKRSLWSRLRGMKNRKQKNKQRKGDR